MKRMELLSPAGSLEKLETAFEFGADSAYMGMPVFSLRANAKNLDASDIAAMKALKSRFPEKNLYCTLNIHFHEGSLDLLKSSIDLIREYPFDGFIVSDIGAGSVIKECFPDKQLRLSTQASCINSSAVKLYHSMGFDTVIVGRETTLDEIKRIKDENPCVGIEAFVHGAMCMSFSGKCFLSSHLTGRSANQGDCAHVCRWNFRLAEYNKVSDGSCGYVPVEGEDFCSLLSSKDLCMIDHLDDLQNAGVDSLKIEGRMKSTYYVATVTRAYRKALDHLYDSNVEYLPFRDDLFNVSHREYSTGFFYNDRPVENDNINIATDLGYLRDYLFLGTVKNQVAPGIWSIDIKNQIRSGESIDFIGPDVLCLNEPSIEVLDMDFNPVLHIDHCNSGYIKTNLLLHSGYIMRKEN